MTEPHTTFPQPDWKHALWQHYSVFDGLAGMQVEDLYQDSQGFLWIATADGGVSRFDGRSFATLTCADGLPHPTVMAVVGLADGRLGFGTLGGGLALYDGRGFQVYGTRDGLPSNEVLGLRLLPDGALWVLTTRGIARFVGERCVQTLTRIAGQPVGWVYDAMSDATGAVWLASRERGVIDLEGRKLEWAGSNGEKGPCSPWKLDTDQKGRLWIADRYTGPGLRVYCYDPQKGVLEEIRGDGDLDQGLVQHGVRHLRVDRRGWLWLARRGVFVFDGKGWQRVPLPLEEEALSDTRLTFEDREGNLWVGFWGGGLACGDPLSLRCFDAGDGLPDKEITALAEDRDGRLWIGTSGGLAQRAAEQIQPAPLLPETPGPLILSLLVDRQDRLWIAGEGGCVYRREGNSFQKLPLDAPEVAISCLYEDRHGRLWVGTTGNRCGYLEDETFIDLETGNLEGIEAIHQDGNDRLWLGAFGHVPALQWYDGRLFHLPTGEGLDQIHYVSALCETPDGCLWIGAEAGLFALREEEIRCFTRQDGLPENAISALTVDRQGRLWIGTRGGGAARYDGQGFQIFRLGSSPPRNMVEAILWDAEGQLWFGTRGGLVAYQPGQTPPGVVIQQVVAGQLFREPEQVNCMETVPEIRFVFQGIGFRAGLQPMRYSYRLSGDHQPGEWSAFTLSTAATFQHLPPGQYVFAVRALDRDDLCSPPAEVALTVTPDPRNHRITVLEETLRYSPVTEEFIGESRALQQVREQIALLADTEMTVLILGETGAGKGLTARALHRESRRRDRPFIHVNCGALPEGLVESELFGHERGAFTSAMARQLGRFELADQGTLFLDEVGDLPSGAQRALLQALEEQVIQRVGGEKAIPVDVRVIAATNRNLQAAVAEGHFRPDLLYRLSGFELHLPPLRQRREDIPPLARYFTERFARHLHRSVPEITSGAMALLQNHPWPGNVRELEHLIQGAVLLCKGRHSIGAEHLPPFHSAPFPAEDTEGFIPLDDYERRYLLQALEAADWVIYGEQGAARLLGIPPERLRSRMRKHGLRRPS